MTRLALTANSSLRHTRVGRTLAAAQISQGVVLLITPRTAINRVVGGALPSPWILRLLAARTLTQGVAGIVTPSPRTFQASAIVDVSHAVTMLVAARIWPTYRRVALLSAAAATLSALAGVAASPQPGPYL